MDSLYDTLSSGLSYVGDAVEKPGRAVRGVLAGKPREAMAAIPFSDSMGLTDPTQRTTGRDLTDHYNLTSRGSNSFGSHAAGFAADMLTDPLNLVAGAGAYRAAPTVAKGLKAGAKAFTGLDMIDHIGGGVSALARGGKNLAAGQEGALSFGSFGRSTSKGVPRPATPREPDLLDLEDFYSAPKNRPASPPGAGQSTLNRVHKVWTPTPESEAITTPSIVAAWRANREGLATVENFPTEWTLKNYDPRVLAHYNPLEHEIGLNMGYRHAPNGASIWQDQAAMQDAMNSMKSSGHMASNSVTHIIDHEIGHGMHRDSLGVGPFMHLHQFGALTPGQLDASRNVSGYAGTNALEAVAETYAGLRNGRLFRGTPAVGKLFKEFAGNPMLEKLGNEGLLKGLGLGVGGLAAGYGLSQASPATSGNYQRSAL